MPLYEITAQDIHRQARANPECGWPRKPGNSRLRPSCLPKINPRFQFRGTDRFFAIGSCFARNIEEAMLRQGLNVASRALAFPESESLTGARANGLLIKYTPGSVLEEIAQALDDGHALPPERYMEEKEPGRYMDLNLPMFYPSVSLERAVARRGQVQDLYRSLMDCEAVFITLGLIEEWHDTKLGIDISGLPEPPIFRRHPGRFVCRQLTYDEAFARSARALDILHAANPRLRMVITTSPVPLTRTFTMDDVIIANMQSKSTLRAVAQALCASRAYADYFPSYEMVMHSDPASTWTEDNIHVQSTKVEEIMSHFLDSYLPRGERAGNVYALLNQAADAYAGERYAEAVALYKEAETRGSLDEMAYTGFINAAGTAGDHELAASLCKTCIAAGLKAKYFSALMLELLLDAGLYERAEEEARAAVDDPEREFCARVVLAILADRAGDLAAARSEISMAKALYDAEGIRNPEMPWALQKLAFLLPRLGL